MKSVPFTAAWMLRARPPIALVLSLLLSLAVRADDSPVPYAWPASRYQSMRQQSPFALATPVQPPAESKASFAANWFVSGLGRFGDDEFVTIKSRDLSTEFSLYGHNANPENGVALASIDWSSKIGKSTVIIKKGTETAKLEFNEAEVHGPPLVATAKSTPAGGNINGAQPVKGGGEQLLKPLPPYSPGVPGLPNPGSRGITPPANRLPPSGQSPGGSNPSQGQDRHRIRIINAPQR